MRVTTTLLLSLSDDTWLFALVTPAYYTRGLAPYGFRSFAHYDWNDTSPLAPRSSDYRRKTYKFYPRRLLTL